MKRNVLIKGMKIVVALVVVIAIGLGATKGGMFLYNKGMFIYESILNKINDVNIQNKQINNKTTNTAGEIKDSLSDKGVRIKINNELINLDFKTRTFLKYQFQGQQNRRECWRTGFEFCIFSG